MPIRRLAFLFFSELFSLLLPNIVSNFFKINLSGFRLFFPCFCAKFERKDSFSWRYFCISLAMSLNSLSETLSSSRAWETELYIESCFARARAWIFVCLFTFRSSFLLTTDRPVEAAPDKAAIAATGAPSKTPMPVIEVTTAPKDRAAVAAPRQTTE